MADLYTDSRSPQLQWATQRDAYGDLLDEEKTVGVHEPGASQPRSLRQQYPLNMTVDFTKLRANALRRYMAFHGIQEIPGSCKDQLAIAVAQHFGEQCKLADEETSIASFLSFIKGVRMQPDSSDSDSRSNSSDDSDELVREEGDRYQSGPYPMSGTLDNAETDNNSSASSSDDDNHPMNGSSTRSAKRSHPSSNTRDRLKTKTSSSSSNSKVNKNKKQRKTRLYCVCKGSSFGNMIACDNKKCSDRSNWYHMACVDLDPSQDPPETWYCPSCQQIDAEDVPENQYRKPVASVTYGDMISHALTALPEGKGSFKEICDFVEKQYESQLNWKLESDQRKSPVWKSSVRKILFSNMRFRKHPDDKGLFCLAA